jgi:hypothetical protein
MKKSVVKSLLYMGIASVGFALSGFAWQQVNVKNETKSESIVKDDGFAVLELFTSQGCSSCPPADAVVAKYALENNPNIIPMSFHVDYWNYIGWQDPFSKATFSERQREYAVLMNTQGNYTPQLIINGKYELVGSKESAVYNLVNKELVIRKQHTIAIKKLFLNENHLDLEFALDSEIPNAVVHVALVKKKEFTHIKRGENSGLKQTNYNIVYNFKTVPSSSDKVSFEFRKEWIATDFLVVAYLQNSKTGKILTAVKSEIN